jgi:hypothetical protein
MSHLSHYIKACMSDVTLTNAQLLHARLHLRGASSTNGLTSVKLHKIRQRLDLEAVSVIAAWTEIDERHAKRAEAGTAIVQKDDTGTHVWRLTGTPAYDADPSLAAQRLAALMELDTASLTVSVPLLTETDLAWVTSAQDIGVILDLFTDQSTIAVA